MTIARSKLVDTSVSLWYHCISRCVRRAFLLSEGDDGENSDRKAWIENRLQGETTGQAMRDCWIWAGRVRFCDYSVWVRRFRDDNCSF